MSYDRFDVLGTSSQSVFSYFAGWTAAVLSLLPLALPVFEPSGRPFLVVLMTLTFQDEIGFVSPFELALPAPALALSFPWLPFFFLVLQPDLHRWSGFGGALSRVLSS